MWQHDVTLKLQSRHGSPLNSYLNSESLPARPTSLSEEESDQNDGLSQRLELSCSIFKAFSMSADHF